MLVVAVQRDWLPTRASQFDHVARVFCPKEQPALPLISPTFWDHVSIDVKLVPAFVDML
jgi:hypothetical protein